MADGEDVVGAEADHYVAKYVNGSISEWQDKDVFGVATDKGQVNKLPSEAFAFLEQRT